MLPVRSEFPDKCLGFVSDSIGYNQVKIFYLRLAFIIKENNDQTGRVQFVFVVEVIGRELYILWLNQIKRVRN